MKLRNDALSVRDVPGIERVLQGVIAIWILNQQQRVVAKLFVDLLEVDSVLCDFNYLFNNAQSVGVVRDEQEVVTN